MAGWDDILATRIQAGRRTAPARQPDIRPAGRQPDGPPTADAVTAILARTGGHPMAADPPDPWHGPLDGPFDQAMWVWLPKVRSKSNFRRYRRNQPRTADQKAAAAYQQQVADTFRLARPAGWAVGNPTDPIAQRPTVLVTFIARTRVDAANVPKSILDAGEGPDGLYLNDASVRRPATLSEYRTGNQAAIVAVATIAPGADLAALHTAGTALDAAAIAQFTSICRT